MIDNKQLNYIEEDEIDLRELFAIVKNNISTIFIVTVISITLALAYLYWGKSIYSSSAIISLQNDSGKSGIGGKMALLNQLGIGDLVNSISIGGGEVESATVILTSKKFLKNILNDINISREYFIQKNFRKVEVENFPNLKIDIKYKDEELYGNYFRIIPLNSEKYILEIDKIDFKKRYNYGQKINNNYFTLQIDKVDGIDPYQIVANQDNHISNYIYSLNLESKSYIFRDLDRDTQMDMLIENMTITDKKSNIIEIKYEGSLPKKTKQIVSIIAENFINKKLEEKNKELDHGLEIVNNQIKEIQLNLNQKIKKIEKFQEKSNLLVSDNGGNIVGDIYAKKLEIESLSLKLQEIKNFINTLKQGVLSSVLLVSVGVDITSIQQLMDDFISTDNAIRELELQQQNIDKSVTSNPQIVSFINELKDRRESLERLLADFTEVHPKVIKERKEIDRLINKINVNIVTNLKKLRQNRDIIKSTILTNITMVKNNLNKKLKLLQKNMKTKKSLLHTLPKRNTLSQNLQKSFRFNEGIYSALMQKRVELEISKVSLVANIKILEDAYIAKKPDKPKKILILIVSGVTGIILGVFFVFFRSFFDNRVKKIEDIESLMNGHILGKLSNFKNDKKFQQDIIDIRTNLQLLTQDKEYVKILITSTDEVENKRILSVALAKSLSEIGKRVIIIDLDLRKPKLNQTFNKLNSNIGISNYLPENIELSTTISNITNNLDFIPAGPEVQDVPALLMSNKFKTLAKQLEKRYNYIIFNAPSIEFKSDIKIVSKHSDIIVLDIIKNLTKRNSIEEFNQLQKEGDFKMVGVVFCE
jgi:capsular exopolysaccharide synthesis family protein